MRIGIDFGGVIVKAAHGDTQIDLTSGVDLMMPGAFEVIAELVSVSKGNAWIVSKASAATRIATRRWLEGTKFYQATRFLPSNVIFCNKRSEKRAICISHGLTHFVDDSREVISHIHEVVPHPYLFGPGAIESWHQLLAAIRE